MLSADATPQRRDFVLRGIALMLVGVVLASIMFIAVKWLSAVYSVFQIVFFRAAVALVPIVYLVARAGAVATLRTANFSRYIARAMTGLIGMTTTFAAFRHLPAVDVVAINFAAPLFVTALSVPLLGEAVGWRRWTAVAVGFAGVLMMLVPDGAGADLGALASTGGLLALAGALGYAMTAIVIRRISRHEPPLAIVFYYLLIVALASAPMLPFVWVTPSAVDLAVFVGLGLIGSASQLAMTRAFALAPLATVMPFEYLSVVITAAIAWAIWLEVPSWSTLAGTALVIASGLFILQRESKLAREALRRG